MTYEELDLDAAGIILAIEDDLYRGDSQTVRDAMHRLLTLIPLMPDATDVELTHDLVKTGFGWLGQHSDHPHGDRAWYMRYLYGLGRSQSEIARHLGISRQAVHQNVVLTPTGVGKERVKAHRHRRINDVPSQNSVKNRGTLG